MNKPACKNKTGARPFPKIDPKGKSIPQIFFERVAFSPHGTAFRYKDLGIYKAVTWNEYFRDVEAFCMGLVELCEKGGRP